MSINSFSRHSIVAFLIFCISVLFSSAANADIYACAGDSIRVFADSASAGAAPIRVISGATTGIDECYGVAVDSLHGELWVAHGPVSVFRTDANGDVAPIRKITDPTMGFAVSVAVDLQANEVIVGAGGLILTYARLANGDANPLRIMQIGAYVDFPDGLIVDRLHDEILVTCQGCTSGVFVFSRLSTGPASPVRPPLDIAYARGLFYDPVQNELYVTGSAGVSVFDRLNGLKRLLEAGPARLTHPWGLSVSNDGEMMVGNQSSVANTADPIFFYPASPLGAVSPTHQIDAGAVGNRHVYGLTTSHAMACAAANVVGDCIFRDGVEF